MYDSVLVFVCVYNSVCVCVCDSRSISVDPDRVDAVLGETTTLEEGTVVTDLYTLARVVTGLEQLHPVVLSMLVGGQTNTERGERGRQLVLL